MTSYTASVKQDLEYGIPKETEVLKMLKPKYPEIQQLPKGNIYDYRIDELTFGELKSRRCRHNQYPTTVLYKSKIENIQEGYDYIFFFYFTDGLYYVEYNEELFDTFKMKNVYRRDRNRYYECVEIPIQYLTKY